MDAFSALRSLFYLYLFFLLLSPHFSVATFDREDMCVSRKKSMLKVCQARRELSAFVENTRLCKGVYPNQQGCEGLEEWRGKGKMGEGRSYVSVSARYVNLRR